MPLRRLVALAVLAGAVTAFVAALLRPRRRPLAGPPLPEPTRPVGIDLREPAATSPGSLA